MVAQLQDYIPWITHCALSVRLGNAHINHCGGDLDSIEFCCIAGQIICNYTYKLYLSLIHFTECKEKKPEMSCKQKFDSLIIPYQK